MSSNTLYVILNKKDLKNNFKKKIDVFTLNEFILSEKEKKQVNNIFPDPIKTSINSASLLFKTHEFKKNIIKKIKEITYFKDIDDLDELLDPFLEMRLSSFFYINDIIPVYKKYILIIKGKLLKFNSKSDLIFTIEKLYSDEINKNGNLYKFSNLNFNFYNNLLLNIQAKLIIHLFKSNKNDINFFSDREAYFIKELKNEISNQKNFGLYYTPTSSYLRIIQILFKQALISIFKVKFREIGMFLLPNKNAFYSYSNLINESELCTIKGLEKNFSNYLIKQIYCNILHSLSYKEYLEKIFKKIKIKKAYFHSLRFADLFSFSRVFNKLDHNVFLISHGSHTLQTKSHLDILSSKSLGIGMTYTNQKGINILSQSKYCDDFLDSLGINYLKINRIMQKRLIYKNNFNISKNNPISTILIIGTVKQLGARRYYVESSGEFIASVNLIYSKLVKYRKQLKIIVRIRNVTNEINNNILNNAFKDKKDLIELGNKNSIYQEIENCDCLISYSSTTLEEGIILNKPVMSFGLPKYNHFCSYENLLKKDETFRNNKTLTTIEKCLGRKFIYKTFAERNINYEF